MYMLKTFYWRGALKENFWSPLVFRIKLKPFIMAFKAVLASTDFVASSNSPLSRTMLLTIISYYTSSSCTKTSNFSSKYFAQSKCSINSVKPLCSIIVFVSFETFLLDSSQGHYPGFSRAALTIASSLATSILILQMLTELLLIYYGDRHESYCGEQGD